MRKDDNEIRHYVPVLRRIVILVAVLTAVPVALWMITASVRDYVGPPKLPTFRPMTASTTTAAPEGGAADSRGAFGLASAETDAAAPRTVVEAGASATDARSTVPEMRTPPDREQPRDIDAKAPADDAGNARAPDVFSTGAVPTLAAPAAADAAVKAAPLGPVAPPALTSPQNMADQQQPADIWPAAPSFAPAEPIAGPVPLPRQRPRLFAMAQTGIPMPRPRPASAPDRTPSEVTPSYPMDDRMLAH